MKKKMKIAIKIEFMNRDSKFTQNQNLSYSIHWLLWEFAANQFWLACNREHGRKLWDPHKPWLGKIRRLQYRWSIPNMRLVSFQIEICCSWKWMAIIRFLDWKALLKAKHNERLLSDNFPSRLNREEGWIPSFHLV